MELALAIEYYIEKTRGGKKQVAMRANKLSESQTAGEI